MTPDRFGLKTGARMLFIPTASSLSSRAPWIDGDRHAVLELGYEPYYFDLSEAGHADAVDALAVCDIVYFTGGNTSHLLSHLKRTDFTSALQRFPDLPFTGASAGAVVAGPDIGVACHFEESIGDLDDLSGLGLTKWRVVPHVDQPGIDAKLSEICFAPERSDGLILLRDDQALWVSEGEKSVVHSELLSCQVTV